MRQSGAERAFDVSDGPRTWHDCPFGPTCNAWALALAAPHEATCLPAEQRPAHGHANAELRAVARPCEQTTGAFGTARSYSRAARGDAGWEPPEAFSRILPSAPRDSIPHVSCEVLPARARGLPGLRALPDGGRTPPPSSGVCLREAHTR